MKFENAKAYRSEISALYKSAFPPEECAPLSFMFRRAEKGKSSFYAVTEAGQFIGLVYTIRRGDLLYVFYLAVVEEHRGKGYGSRILQTVKEQHLDCTVILNIEDPHDESAPNREERLRRLAFYERQGFADLRIQTTEAGVVYELLGTDTAVRREEYLELMRGFMGRFIFRLVFREK